MTGEDLEGQARGVARQLAKMLTTADEQGQLVERENHLLQWAQTRIEDAGLPGLSRSETFTLTLDGMFRAPDKGFQGIADAYVGALIEPTLKPSPSTVQLQKLAQVELEWAQVAKSKRMRGASISLAWKAASAFQEMGDYGRADSARYLARSQEEQDASTAMRAMMQLSKMAAGYGFRPYRLVAVWLAIAAVFSLLYCWLTPLDLSASIEMSFAAQLGLLSPATESLSARWAVIGQTALGVLLTSIFFALIVGRWFRSK